MSVLSIAAYYPFRRVCLFGQRFRPVGDAVCIDIRPDRRFRPVCHVCGRQAGSIHAWGRRSVRDLNMGSVHVWLNCSYRKIVCSICNRIQVEDLDIFEPYKRVTRRFARYIYDLCKIMTVEDVARHLDLDWKTVKDIDRVRIDEHQKAAEKDKDVFKGARFLLLKNRRNVRKQKHREQLKELLAINEPITSVMILKDKLKHIWTYKNRTWASKAIKEWCDMARSIGHPDIDRFTNTLERYQYGIINHCEFPINTGRLEGINNKIKVIKRKAYGFHDDKYFQLKILQAFDSKMTN